MEEILYRKENGMKYDEDYYYNLLKMQTKYAKHISEIRWKFVKKCNARYILDYGSGVGFFKAFASPQVHVDTYDIGPYVMTGIKRDVYDLICLWDVLEHIPYIDDRLGNLFSRAKHIALTIPILPKKKNLKTWKHFKPGEHLHYFDDEILNMIFDRYAFERTKSGYPECPPREDVESILYGRKE